MIDVYAWQTLLEPALKHRLFPDQCRAALAIIAKEDIDLEKFDSEQNVLQILQLLIAVGMVDLGIARIIEGHINALQLIRKYGSAGFRRDVKRLARDPGFLIGVWNADAADDPLRVEAGQLAGTKKYASGANFVSHAIVTTDANAPDITQMYLAEINTAGVSVSLGAWDPLGMKRTESGDVTWCADTQQFTVSFGKPGDYQLQPFFFSGAIRFVAALCGGNLGLYEMIAAELRSRKRTDHPHQKHRLAQSFVAARSAYLATIAAAAYFDGSGEKDVLAAVASARIATENSIFEMLDLAPRSIGLEGWMAANPVSRRLTDLSVYVRQPNPDGARDAVGEAAAAQIIRPAD